MRGWADRPGREANGAAPAALLLAAYILAILAAGGGRAAASGPPGAAALLVEGARLSVEAAPRYDGSYVKLAYPGGDPGRARGVCADVVVRAFRHAGVDLQRLVHEDVVADPRRYGIRRADPSIDHRRVRNLKTFLDRHAERLTTSAALEGRGEWLAGDLVVWDLYGGHAPNHVGIVSDRRGASGLPLVFHHFPRVAGFTGVPAEDDCLARWRILAHYRWR